MENTQQDVTAAVETKTQTVTPVESKKAKNKIYAIVTTKNPDGFRVIEASLYSELQEILAKDASIDAVTMIVRGRKIHFQEQRKLKFHV